MEKTHYYIKGAKASKLHIICWKNNDNNTKKVIHLLHGMAEYADRYEDFAEYLVNNGYTVYAHDHRKHGESLKGNQRRGIFDSSDNFANITEDVKLVQRFIMKKEAVDKVILLGHSMGSLIARRYAQRYGEKLEAIILLGSMYQKTGMLFWGIAVSFLARLMSKDNKRSIAIDKAAFGNMNNSIKKKRTSYDWISSDEEQVDKYISDGKCGFRYSHRFYVFLFLEILKGQKKNTIRKTPDIPILFISGKEDPIGYRGEGVKKLFQSYLQEGYRKKTKLHLVEGARHELLNEVNNREIYDYIRDWIKDVTV